MKKVLSYSGMFTQKPVCGRRVTVAGLSGRHKRGLRAAGSIRANSPKMKDLRIWRWIFIL